MSVVGQGYINILETEMKHKQKKYSLFFHSDKHTLIRELRGSRNLSFPMFWFCVASHQVFGWAACPPLDVLHAQGPSSSMKVEPAVPVHCGRQPFSFRLQNTPLPRSLDLLSKVSITQRLWSVSCPCTLVTSALLAALELSEDCIL